jgi:hypothetical protein
VSFICEKEIMVLTSIREELTVHHLVVQSGKMNEKKKMSAEVKLSQGERIRQVNILGNVD